MNAPFTHQSSIFDTRFDTKTIFVTTRHRFSLRTYIDQDGNSLLYLDVTDKYERVRLNTEIYVPRKFWDQKKQRLKTCTNSEKYNLILENIVARLTTIKTAYMLQDRMLSARTLIEEFQCASPDFDFISFYRHHLNLQPYKKQTVKNHKSVLKKLEAFSKEIPFHKITAEFLLRYRKFYIKNSEITYQSDLKCIKVYLNIAEKKGIRLSIRPDDIKVNVVSNKTVYLEPLEMKQLIKYYFDELVIDGKLVLMNPTHILPLGYFLFSCYTGLRISDIQNKTRKEILEDRFNFSSVKTDRQQYMRLNHEARRMVSYRTELFEQKLSDQKINMHLKNIATVCQINKHITMHVGRHTFATTFIRNKGDVFRLKMLLGHAKIEHTQKYVHIVNEEVLDDVDIISFN